ncbi:MULTISPECIES: peptidoglycan-associated lipoprotein Pal [Pasteurellaceae]|uniref:Peptidoglycan-associated lipoprotein n=1 Tax=Pasteurella atlantica TaxID=2827233 RepID=A0AAW8CII6_9PAST|nr:peptidoglycan-associated lipoprotein Pal [Pasteurella atlantica]MBR0572813.1 peptidoglycan-associated lipoprotein Pal [Pasteurella atlantica]MDP8038741.1 peptidoglycan-associated lipoprotein Pal [Pasteurella atlantica]MDP8040833.1 peptidoglycan-associated lipoprotein Pal [Pasteurella atlantica]MDP8042994.1 peptidoglycan-associated lipoprotein Pal [Pasteurella atlantica]MDP8045080.1 peptidoglycan-associated lipoprotein Pal [Pasteurella atlantica]
MKKMAKILMIATPVFVLAACSSSNSTKVDTTAVYGGMTAQELQQRYNTVYFGFDRYQVEGEYQSILDGHSAFLNAHTNTKVAIEGHADERGTPEYNIALGQRRADAVQNYLTARGVNSSQLSTVSYGEEKPAVLGHSEADYAKNRRAVLAY